MTSPIVTSKLLGRPRALALCLGALSAAMGAKVPVPAAGCYLSAYDEQGQKSFETLVQKEIAVGMFYVDWNLADFPKDICDKYAATGTVPHLSWEPFGPANSLQKIIDGSRDAYIRKWAQQVKSWGKPLFIRFGLEMNGNWYDWDGTHSGGSALTGFGDPAKPDGPERFVAAHRHIHGLFKAEGATNVSWVFAPNIISEPDVAWNRIENYYPGADYVDWLGLDGYNWGNTNGGSWQSFDEVFKKPYATMLSLGDQPVMIAEYASAESGGDKGAWVADAHATLKRSYPRIKAITWFNINKETDWRVNSSEATLQAYRKAIADPYFLPRAATPTAALPMSLPAGALAGSRLTRARDGLAFRISVPAAVRFDLRDSKGVTVHGMAGNSDSFLFPLGNIDSGTYFLRVASGRDRLRYRINVP